MHDEALIQNTWEGDYSYSMGILLHRRIFPTEADKGYRYRIHTQNERYEQVT